MNGEVLKWLRENLPAALVLAGVIYTWMRIKLNDEIKAHEKTKLTKELVENDLAVEREFSGRNDPDIIKSITDRGRKP